MKSRLILCSALWVTTTWLAAAQQPAKPAAPPPTAPVQEPPKIDPGYVYEPAGRRDPFVSLVGRGTETKPGTPRPSGLGGLLIGEVNVKGVLRDKSGFIAMLQGPDNKTYNVRVGDKLLDGSVKAITHEQVIFSQDVNDPLSLVKQRDVPKPVRQPEGRG